MIISGAQKHDMPPRDAQIDMIDLDRHLYRLPHSGNAARALIAMLLMLTLEGALRKWVSAGLTVPLIALRDGFAVVVIIYAWRHGFLVVRRGLNLLLAIWVSLVIIWGFCQILFGASDPLTMLVGLRFWCLYLVFGIALGRMLDASGISVFIRIATWMLILMTPLVVLQFLSPAGSFINRQIDGDEASVFVSAMGIVRTSGTFSFTVGFTTLLGLLTPFLVASFMEHRTLGISPRLATVGFASLAVCTAVSGSRAVIIFFLVFVASATIAGLLTYGAALKKRALVMLVGAAFFAGASILVLPATFSSMKLRFQQASEVEDFSERAVIAFVGDSYSHSITTWRGLGIGVGSGLGSYFSTGERRFLAGEAESGRILAEGGVIGGFYLLLKTLLAFGGGAGAWVISRRTRSTLALLVWVAFIPALFTWSAIGQLTVHGFFGLFVALALGSLKGNRFAAANVTGKFSNA